MREECFDLWRAHVGRVALAVVEDEALDPVHVGLLGAVAVVLDAQSIAHAIEQPRLLRRHVWRVFQCSGRCRRNYDDGCHFMALRGWGCYSRTGGAVVGVVEFKLCVSIPIFAL